MKSRISFFNKTVYKKNFALFWPIFAGLLLYEILRRPVYMMVHISVYKEADLAMLLRCMNEYEDLILTAAASVIVGMALFHYLFAAKSANMIHALPVTRLELFGTSLANGLTFLLVPKMISFILSVIVCLANGMAQVQYLGMWLLGSCGTAFLFFSIVVFCAMFTGHVFALPVYFVICNVLVVGVLYGGIWLADTMATGVYSSEIDCPFLEFLSPFVCLWNRLSVTGYYETSTVNGGTSSVLAEIQFDGYSVLAVYMLAALVIDLAAYYCYKRRDIECAGDLLAFEWVKPVFRWGVGICVGFLCGTLAAEFLEKMFVDIPLFFWAVLIAVIAAAAFFMAEMLVQKSFHVLCKRRVVECGAFLCFAMLIFAGIYGYAYHETYYIPDEEQIEYAYISMNYPVEFEGEDAAAAVALHREILQQLDEIGDKLEETMDEYGYGYVSVVYRLKDGSEVSRAYEIPSHQDVSESIFETIYGWELQEDNFLRYFVEYDYADVNRFTDGQVVWQGESEDESIYRYIGSEDTERLYEAVCADLEAGVLQKYNLTDYRQTWEERNSGQGYAILYINFYHSNSDWQTMYDREWGTYQEGMYDEAQTVSADSGELRGSMCIGFGADCENILQALRDCGAVASNEEIGYFDE